MMTEVLSKGDLKARAEMLLMGHVIQVTDEVNQKYIVDYVSRVLANVGNSEPVKSDEIWEKAFEFISNKEKTKVIGLSLNTIMNEMVVLTLIFKDFNEELFDIEDPKGVFCYCYNYTYPDCSELGYSFFKQDKSTHKLHRIG